MPFMRGRDRFICIFKINPFITLKNGTMSCRIINSLECYYFPYLNVSPG